MAKNPGVNDNSREIVLSSALGQHGSLVGTHEGMIAHEKVFAYLDDVYTASGRGRRWSMCSSLSVKSFKPEPTSKCCTMAKPMSGTEEE